MNSCRSKYSMCMNIIFFKAAGNFSWKNGKQTAINNAEGAEPSLILSSGNAANLHKC